MINVLLQIEVHLPQHSIYYIYIPTPARLVGKLTSAWNGLVSESLLPQLRQLYYTKQFTH
jgi:hypothetical protein